jgi:Domain of unknown function (DUF4376)
MPTNTKTYFKENLETGKPITEFPITIPINTESVSNFFLLPEKDLNSHGYFRVIDNEEPPEFDVRTQTLTFSYKKEKNKYVKKWEIVEKTSDEVIEYDTETKKELNLYTNRKRKQLVDTGIEITTSSNKTIPVDTRNLLDLFNIISLGIMANAKKNSNNNDLIKFRGADNNVQELTNDEAIEIGINLTSKIQKIYEKSWTIKNQIDAGIITTNSQIDNHLSTEI